MAVSIKLFNGAFDVTDRTVVEGKSSASLNDQLRQIAKIRNYLIIDNEGNISPFSLSGAMNLNSWRNGNVVEKDRTGQTVFDGTMRIIKVRLFPGFQVGTQAAEYLTNLLSWTVDDLDITTHSGFTVKSNWLVGQSEIDVENGTTDIPVNSLISFTSSLVPRYLVVESFSSPTNKIKLERGLEVNISNGDGILVSVPSVKTFPEAIEDALIAIGLGFKIGSTFAQLKIDDTASNLFVWLNVPREKGVSLSSHLSQLLDMSWSYLQVDRNGTIDIVRGLKWSESTNFNLITEQEILISPEPELRFDSTNLVQGYQTLARSAGDLIVLETASVTNDLIIKYANQKWFTPVRVETGNFLNYTYLYNNSTAASFFGNEYLSVNGAPRLVLSCGLKGSFNGKPEIGLELELAKEYFLSLPVAPNNRFVQEPARVKSYTYDRESHTYQAEFILTNIPLPNILRIVNNPLAPNIQASFGVNNGLVLVLDSVGGTSVLVIEILNEFNIKVLTAERSRGAGTITDDPNGDYVQVISSAIIKNGRTLLFRVFTRDNGQISDKTNFAPFTANPRPQGAGTLEVGLFHIP